MCVFEAGTLTSKGFWLGIIMLVGGAGLIVVGNIDQGVELIMAGAVMIVGRDTMQKVINGGSK
jgi:hypothetical protein